MRYFNDLVDQYLNRFDEARIILESNGIYLSCNDIYKYLVNSSEINEHENLVLKEIPSLEIAIIVEREYKRFPASNVVEEVTLEESIIPSNIPVFLVHQKVKIKGEIWVIHKNDIDPFPSNPHAHNYENNLVVHLGNGDIYKKRKMVGKLERKKLEYLRVNIRGVELPELCI